MSSFESTFWLKIFLGMIKFSQISSKRGSTNPWILLFKCLHVIFIKTLHVGCFVDWAFAGFMRDGINDGVKGLFVCLFVLQREFVAREVERLVECCINWHQCYVWDRVSKCVCLEHAIVYSSKRNRVIFSPAPREIERYCVLWNATSIVQLRLCEEFLCFATLICGKRLVEIEWCVAVWNTSSMWRSKMSKELCLFCNTNFSDIGRMIFRPMECLVNIGSIWDLQYNQRFLAVQDLFIKEIDINISWNKMLVCNEIHFHWRMFGVKWITEWLERNFSNFRTLLLNFSEIFDIFTMRRSYFSRIQEKFWKKPPYHFDF